MEGKIGFHQELMSRLQLLHISKTHIRKWTKILSTHITPSVMRNKAFFTKYREQIFVVSGAFKECIIPVTEKLDILPTHVYANSFIFDQHGRCKGVNLRNRLAYDNGKAEIVQSLKLEGTLLILGDGNTDLQIKKLLHTRAKFVAFTENVTRQPVVEQADYVVKNFDGFVRLAEQIE